MDPNHYIWICWPQLRLDTIVTLMQILVNLSRMGHRYTWEDIPNGTCINYDLLSCYWVEHRDTAVGRYGVNADVGG